MYPNRLITILVMAALAVALGAGATALSQHPAESSGTVSSVLEAR